MENDGMWRKTKECDRSEVGMQIGVWQMQVWVWQNASVKVW